MTFGIETDETPAMTDQGDQIITAILAEIPANEAGLGAVGMVDTMQLLAACCALFDAAGVKPGEIKTILASLRSGYGPWLRTVADAILDAKISETHRDLIYGAFRMAEMFLFDIHSDNRAEVM